MAGLRFGDQILQIDGQTVAGWDTDKAMSFLKKCNPQKIMFAIRDRLAFSNGWLNFPLINHTLPGKNGC